MIKKSVKTIIESPVILSTKGLHVKSAASYNFSWVCNNCNTKNTHKQSSSGIYNCTNCGLEVRGDVLKDLK